MLKNTVCILFYIYTDFLKRSHGSLNYIPTILDEFKLHHPIIINTLIDAKDLVSIVKSMSFQGHQINFNQNGNNMPYQSYLIFTKLRNFKWKLTNYVPIMVISRIENAIDLKKVDVSIGSEVLFLDWFSFKVYESYTVNEIHITRYLGQFQVNETGRHGMIFVPSKDYTSSMEKRRDNLHGLNIKVGAARDGLPYGVSDPAEFPDKVIYFPNNETYDVTNLVTNSENKHEFFMVLNWMQTKLNFTAKVFLRKDMKYGTPKVLKNGSIELDNGAIRDVFEGTVELLCSPIFMLKERAKFGTFLPPIYSINDAIDIPKVDSAESLDWNVFWGPLSSEIWIALLLKCIIFTMFAYIIEWLHNYNMVRSRVVY